MEGKARHFHQRTLDGQMASLVIDSRLVAASLEVVVQNVVIAVDEGEGCGLEIGAPGRHAGQFFGEVVTADGTGAGDLLQGFAPPLQANLAQHRLLRVKRALKLLI